MNFFKKLFGNNKKDETAEDKTQNYTGNSKLDRLLDTWERQESQQSYLAVVKELFDGDSYLFLPSINEDSQKAGEIKNYDLNEAINLTSIKEQDGISVLYVFSNADSLLGRTGKESQYTIMPARDIFNICEEQDIDRIIINSGQKNTFVLNRNHEKATGNNEDTDEELHAYIDIPEKPLNEGIVTRLNENFNKLSMVEEAYQYTQTLAEEITMIIGISLSTDSEKIRRAVAGAINDAFEENKPEAPFQMMILDEDWIESMKEINNPPFYKKQ